ncbi:MAG: hypothetical protein HY804_05725 [Nitrospinae bacterium]|nr:hypothetical protein [Nitrospinota bacterium]
MAAMTDFARKFPLALALGAFGVAGFVSLMAGATTLAAASRALVAGALFYPFGWLLSYLLLSAPLDLPKARGPRETEPEQTAAPERDK